MLKIEEWGNNKPLMLTMLAQLMASFTGYVVEGCQRARNRDYPLPDTKSWIKQYTEFNIFNKELITSFIPAIDGDTFDWCMSAYQSFIHPTAEDMEDIKNTTPEQWQEIRQNISDILKEVYQFHISEIKSEITNQQESAPANFDEIMQKTEVLFFLRVYIPCWVEYGVSPEVLYKNALAGNLDSIEKLLRIDPMILESKAFRQRLYRLEKELNPRLRKKILSALTQRPLEKLDIKSVKIKVAALLYLVADFWEIKLRELEKATKVKQAHAGLKFPEIRDLFDNAAHDFYGLLVDGTLQDGEEAFYKAVKRAKAHWHIPQIRTK